MAAPTSLENCERSRIRTLCPERRRAMAHESPQMPPPAMRMLSVEEAIMSYVTQLVCCMTMSACGFEGLAGVGSPGLKLSPAGFAISPSTRLDEFRSKRIESADVSLQL